MKTNLHCPTCNNIIKRITDKTFLSDVLYCRKCKGEWQTVIANGKVYEIKENKGDVGHFSEVFVYRQMEDGTLQRLKPKEFVIDDDDNDI